MHTDSINKMFQKIIFKILLICLLLEQVGKICLAKPTNNEVKEQTTSTNGLCNYKTTLAPVLSSEKDGQLLPSIQLLKFTITGLINNTLTFVEKAKHTSDQILKDQEILQIGDNDEVKIFIQKLYKFQENYKSCKHFKEIDHILELFLIECGEYFYQEEEENLSSDGEVILKVLKKHDFEKLLDEFEINCNKFIKKFDEKYEILKEPMKEENNKIYEKISQWYEEFRMIKEYDRKISAFLKFVELYRMEFLGN